MICSTWDTFNSVLLHFFVLVSDFFKVRRNEEGRRAAFYILEYSKLSFKASSPGVDISDIAQRKCVIKSTCERYNSPIFKFFYKSRSLFKDWSALTQSSVLPESKSIYSACLSEYSIMGLSIGNHHYLITHLEFCNHLLDRKCCPAIEFTDVLHGIVKSWHDILRFRRVFEYECLLSPATDVQNLFAFESMDWLDTGCQGIA